MSKLKVHTVTRFVWVSAKFGTYTVVSVNGTLIEDKLRRFKDEFSHFSLNKCPIYSHDGASDKFSTNSHVQVERNTLHTARQYTAAAGIILDIMLKNHK